jgi:hypothetical protein
MIADDHPFFFLESLFARRGAVFQFSRYVYTPDSLFDEREVFDVHGSDLSVEWLQRQIDQLNTDQELAFHSRVQIDGRTHHIPMLDFATDEIGPDQLYRARSFLPERVFATTAFYHSGRSYHAYSTHLLGPKDWHSFLGRVLLINPRDGNQIIDTRWIGHRLIAGYCSLRFSNNSGQYKGMPKRASIRTFMENRSTSKIGRIDLAALDDADERSFTAGERS